jgi:ribose 5-phosphate isomerase RpiB
MEAGMRIALISETSAADKNSHILAALQERGHHIVNAGMTDSRKKPELQYIHTGLMAAILLNSRRADFIVGGCGTGQGFLNSVVQYPGVICGHILTPLDAYLFARINGGNCVSLALNEGYGWASDVNLTFIFDGLFAAEFGSGYPSDRKKPQERSRLALGSISDLVHRPFAEIIRVLPDDILQPVLRYPGMRDLISPETIDDLELRASFLDRLH